MQFVKVLDDAGRDYRKEFRRPLPIKAEQAWVKKQKKLLLSRDVYNVIKNKKDLVGTSKQAENLIVYYEGNKERMDYKHDQVVGCGLTSWAHLVA